MAYYKATQDPSADVRTRSYLPELLRGLAVTARHFLRNLFGDRDLNPQVVNRRGANLVSTVAYPEERPFYPPGYRGLHRLVPREDGKPRCVACYMCATVCPAQCIYIEAGEYERADPSTESRVIEKYPTAFVIDELRCIVCGFCVEACPKDAIRMDRTAYLDLDPKEAAGPGGPAYDPKWGHTPSAYRREDFVYDIPKLLGGPAVSHPSDPWTKRPGSERPAHVHKEAHTRIGEGLAHPPAALPASNHARSRVEVDTHQPIPITKFYK